MIPILGHNGKVSYMYTSSALYVRLGEKRLKDLNNHLFALHNSLELKLHVF